MANDIHVEEELHKLGNDVKSLNVLIASLLIGFEAFRGLGKISMSRTKDGVSNARALLLR